MGWTELRERNSNSGMERAKNLLHEMKENMEELCEMLEDVNEHSYGERDGYGEREQYRMERERRGRRY